MKIQKFLILLAIFFLLNLLWESLHYPLYNDFSGMQKFPRLVIASMGDLVLIITILTIVSLKNKNLEWIRKPSKSDYLCVIFLGMIIAVIVEINGLTTGQWSYKESMPTIFGIGLSPFVQLFTTTIVSLKIFNYLNKSRKSD